MLQSILNCHRYIVTLTKPLRLVELGALGRLSFRVQQLQLGARRAQRSFQELPPANQIIRQSYTPVQASDLGALLSVSKKLSQPEVAKTRQCRATDALAALSAARQQAGAGRPIYSSCRTHACDHILSAALTSSLLVRIYLSVNLRPQLNSRC